MDFAMDFEFIAHPLRLPSAREVGRCHPVEGYQWWDDAAACWVRGAPWFTDHEVSWEDTWCEPEAED